jgi:outer membrane protein OmpA-like peptidoglycan-associated protein
MPKQAKNRFFLIAAVCGLLLCGSRGFSEEVVNFQTTEEEMVDELTREPARTRSWQPVVETRSIEVVEKQGAGTVKKAIAVAVAADEPRVNLKIEFDYDSYAIRDASFPLLNELGKALRHRRLIGKRIVIKGHTDSDGAAGYNLTLSLNRAQSVKQYLTANCRVPPERLKVVGYGEALPLAPNTTAAGKQMNRRVEVQLER